MSSTPRNSPVQYADDVRLPPRVPPIVALALLVAVLGGVAVAVAPLIGVGSGQGASGSIVSASVFAALCALAVPAVAIGVCRRSPSLAGALLAGIGAMSLGVAILDVQLFVDAIDANRLELFRPISAGLINAGMGAYVALIGHGLLVVAGGLGLVIVHRESERDGYGSARAAEYDGRSVGARIGTWPTAAAIFAAIAYVLALFGPAFDSQDPIFLVRPLVDSPAASALGTGLVAVALLIVTAVALTSISSWVGAGALVGAGIGALGVSGTRVVAGLAGGDRIGVGVGSIVGALAAVVIVGIGAAVPALTARRESRAAVASAPASAQRGAARRGNETKSARKAAMIEQARAEQARVRKLHRLAGALGVIAAALAATGASLPVLSLPEGVPEPSILATRIVLLAAGVLLVASLGLFLPGRANMIRPVLGTLWTTVVMGAAAVLQPVVIATDVPGVGLGIGVFVLGAASVVAAATGIALWLAGTAEREDIDTSVEYAVNRAVLVVGGIGGVLSLAGTALPLYRGERYSAASVGDWPWGINTWGQLLVGVAVLVAVLIAPRARPARAKALLIGSAATMLAYVISGPLTSSRIPDATVGVGAITAGTGLLLLVVAVLLVRATQSSAQADKQ
ncbi:hypothetical protein [Rhodococcus sp. IEGM 1379]|uniref:hypothetical protein n=1 Tax=Rhodococcus sp. IEGM 1379 TaxID=3047086 RepID=UPI0024B86820|nr:hypothetical protein [Rhodococcus sp. IEGM 1379]MDI9915250.1 hypothetical protein [Rhodococcus sp. IEGM 1379]